MIELTPQLINDFHKAVVIPVTTLFFIVSQLLLLLVGNSMIDTKPGRSKFLKIWITSTLLSAALVVVVALFPEVPIKIAQALHLLS